MEWVSEDWAEFYPDAEEVIPPDAPEPRGPGVQLNVFCDAAHATDLVTRRSVTGISWSSSTEHPSDGFRNDKPPSSPRRLDRSSWP